MPNIEKIQSKIQKLLALSNSDNEHEAALAMRRAQDLMTKYNIDMADALVNITSSDIQEDTIELKVEVSNWVNALASACGNLFDCKTLVVKHGDKTWGLSYTFISTTANTSSAKYLLEHLIKCWKTFARDDYKAYKSDASIFDDVSQFRFNNSHGCSYSSVIHSRVCALLQERETELAATSGVAALVPVKTADAVKLFVEKTYPLLKMSQGASSSSYSGKMAGKKAGERVPLGGAITQQIAGALN